MFLGKQSKVLSDALSQYFENTSNPYVSLLKLIDVLSEDRTKGKASTMIHTSKYILHYIVLIIVVFKC